MSLKQKLLQQKLLFKYKNCDQNQLKRYFKQIFHDKKINYIMYFILVKSSKQIYYKISNNIEKLHHQLIADAFNIDFQDFQPFVYINYEDNLFDFYMYNDLGQLINCNQHKQRIYWQNYSLINSLHFNLNNVYKENESSYLKYEIDN